MTTKIIINDIPNNPPCPHGPTIKFHTETLKKDKTFYACSTARDRKDCGFYREESELEKYFNNELKMSINQTAINKYIGDINRSKLMETLKLVRKLPRLERMYCRTCEAFTVDVMHKVRNNSHEIKTFIDDKVMEHPTQIILPITNAKKEAQFFFNNRTISAIISALQYLQITNFICIGTPTIHEQIKIEGAELKSFLLDFDKRFLNFYQPDEFAWYNACNNHFFLEKSRKNFEIFLKLKGLHTAIVIDPPYGAHVELIAWSLKQLQDLHHKLNETNIDLPVFWIFPYFQEPRISHALPEYKMLDYKVEYENNKTFLKRKAGSPIRIFTNVPPKLVRFPQSHGYVYCKMCQRMVAEKNKHCKECNTCPSKNGATYKHCYKCKRCVKPTWEHCDECAACKYPVHECLPAIPVCNYCKDEGHHTLDCKLRKEACFNCGKLGHQKSECPEPLVKKRKIKVKPKFIRRELSQKFPLT